MKKQFFDYYTGLMYQFLSSIPHEPVDASPAILADRLYQLFEVEDLHLADDSFYFAMDDYYTKTVIPHKIEVYKAGIELATRFMNEFDLKRMRHRLLYHDFSKFSCDEHYAYVQYNFNDKSKNSKGMKAMFEKAWNHHKHHNDHHPEHWLAVNRDGTTAPIEMDKLALMEMVADWIGAGKTYGSTLEEWLPKNIDKFVFHPKTATDLKWLLLNVTDHKIPFINFGTKVSIMDNPLKSPVITS